ncbi:MAG: hypothetical protein OK438_07025 [Thaumarchaeota archaeon]|nr:hypothetical protein [Nitrososphaerota archaeon]
MSSIERAAHVIKSLKDEEWRTLAGLERAATGQGTADLGRLSRMSRLPVERVRFAVGRLQKTGLVARHGAGFALTKEAVEAMALKDYVKKDLIFALGAIIAKGKESDVYEAVTEEGTPYALKFYKLGRTSFTKVRKKRFKEESGMRSWVTANYEAANREYNALRKLEGISPTFPKVISHSRSTVLLEELSGVRLSQRPELEDAGGAERDILESMRMAYVEAGLVNGDLSEYNVLTDGRHFWLIDWPQAVGRAHPNSAELMEHDVTAIVRFFTRAYGVGLDRQRALEFAKGESESLE